MNNQKIVVELSVDVDRLANEYARGAVEALDPTKKGLTNRQKLTADELDKMISKKIALDLVRSLLNGEIDWALFGNSTVRIVSPKNLTEVMEQLEESDE